MPFYATTADLAVTRLTDWLSLAHRQAEKPAAGTVAGSSTGTGTGVP